MTEEFHHQPAISCFKKYSALTAVVTAQLCFSKYQLGGLAEEWNHYAFALHTIYPPTPNPPQLGPMALQTIALQVISLPISGYYSHYIWETPCEWDLAGLVDNLFTDS